MKSSMFLALGFGAFIVTGNVLTNESGNWHKGQMSDAVYFDHTLGPDGGYASFGADLYPDSILTDTVPPPEEREGDFVTDQNGNPFDLKDPPAITQTVEYDPETGYYLVTEKVGNAYYRPPTYMTFDEYQNFIAEQEQKAYFAELGRSPGAQLGADPIKPYMDDVRADLAERLFGKGGINIRPQGNIDLTFGGDYQRIDNPILTQQQQRNGGFDFDMNIQMNVVGTIGERLKLSTSYNTQATFDVDNQIKLEFLSDGLLTEDAIIKKIEAGNVSLPLRSTLIQGSQSLFGFKTQLQFGRLTTTLLVSQQQSRRKEITLQNGTQTQNFQVSCDQYDENRHFYLSQYNRASFEPSLKNIPQINTLFRITKLEVWVTNDRNVTDEVRDIVAITDLGETEPDKLANPARVNLNPTAPRDLRGLTLPDNEANDLYERLRANPNARQLDNTVATLEGGGFGMRSARDFSKVRARKLQPTEYTFHPELGFVSLNINLQPDHVVGVSYQYTYNGQIYQVGEFSQDLPLDADTLNVMYVKMLKSVNPRIDIPLWDLMMKNVYNLGVYQVSNEEFHLDVFYQDFGAGDKRFLPTGPLAQIPLITLLNLDNLNRVNDPLPDGQFDYVQGLTILPQNGRVIFPVVEPFGSSLKEEFRDDATGQLNPVWQDYVYQELYDSTITAAREIVNKNRFVIKGSCRSSASADISLGAFNIPRGSVTVTAGGQILRENVDYTIDYNIGRLRILNDAIVSSGLPIRVSFEDNSLFGFQQRSMIGSRFDFFINENFNIGGTFLRLSERPFTQKVNIGDDPIANNVVGVDVQYSADAPWLTRLVDKLPLFSTKAPSRINFTGEVAMLIPGHPKVIQQGIDDGGTVYLDDFEGSTARFPLGIPSNNWQLSSTPRTGLFPEGSLVNNYDYGKNRARLAWYNLDPIFTLNQAPDDVTPEAKRSTYVRQIDLRDVFPNARPGAQQQTLLRTFDLAFYPKERGPYNYEVAPTTYSAGIDPNSGELLDPTSRWGGIMRGIETNDFEAANFEFVEFWVMSPFKEGRGGTGCDLYVELGDISEDVLKDSRRFFENGLPRPLDSANVRIDTTAWSRIPRAQPITNAFDNDPAVREVQDVGLDGFTDEGEQVFLAPFLSNLEGFLTNGNLNPAYTQTFNDPATDNFRFYLSEEWNDQPPADPIVGRYRQFNGPEGNSPAAGGGGAGNLVAAGTNIPDNEDVNRDNTLTEDERFFQYRVQIRPDPNTPGEMLSNQYTTSYVVDTYNGPNGEDSVRWTQIKIPLDQFTGRVGNIQDFRSIRFMRVYMTNAEEEIVLRFARFDLVRNQWRRYRFDDEQAFISTDEDEFPQLATFDMNQVNFEENANRVPIPYTLPPGIAQERALGPFADAFQNEQALSMRVCNLRDGQSRSIFKYLNLDLRVFKRLKMFIHAEPIPISDAYQPGELRMYVRLGNDFERNYYEYEIPLTMSPPDADEPLEVWLAENNLDFPLQLLVDAKKQRDAARYPLNEIFGFPDPENPNNTVRVIGNPDLGLVESIMVGLLNPADDGEPKCAEVWINELRVTGFDERGGQAATARLDMTLADLGNLTLAGTYKGIGWGSIEQRVQQRQRESIGQYDISTTLALDKFFPKKWGLRLPFFAQVSNEIHRPEYDPYQTDVKLSDKLALAQTRQERDSLRKQAVMVNSLRSFNFTNVRKERANPKAKPMPWDIANFSISYAWSKRFRRTPLIASDEMLVHEAGLNYNFAGQPVSITPFKKLIKKGKYLKWIQEFNFNPMPNGLTFSTNLTRRYGITQYRFTEGPGGTFYEKQFLWDRVYGINWDLTKSLRFNFNATNNAVIDELTPGPADQQVIYEGLRKFGRNKNYTHQAGLSYQLPFKLIPILDWIDVRAQYQTSYGWSAASLNADSLGNVIRNTQNRQLNGDFNFVNLYNKNKYFKKLNTPPVPKKGKEKDKDPKEGEKDKEGREKEKEKPDPAAAEKDKGKGKDKKKERELSVAERIFLRPLFLIRRARFNYQEEFATILPGFTPVHKYLGMDKSFNAPGLDFVAGMQPDTNWLNRAAQNGWITRNIFLNQQFQQTHRLTYDAQVSIEPFRDFKIDVDIKKQVTENYSEFFKVDSFAPNDQFRHLVPMTMGNFNITYMPIRTLFKAGGPDNEFSQTFANFENYRQIISQRLGIGAHLNPDDANAGFTRGYGRYQQDVLVASFLAAYNGENPQTVFLGDIRKLFPMPNWRLTYNGLNKVKPFDKIFTSVSLTHAYKSTLSVNTFATDLDFQESPTRVDPNTQSFYSRFEFPDIVINEQFSPLIGIDMRFKNELTARFDYKKSRNVSVNFFDYTVAETKTTEMTIGAGYRLKNVDLISIITGKKKKKKKGPDKPEEPRGGLNLGLGTIKPQNDLNFKFDFSVRDDITINHILDQNVSQPTRGQKTIRISPSIDYIINNRLTIRAFYDYNRTVPATSISFPITNIQGGLTVRFTLSQ